MQKERYSYNYYSWLLRMVLIILTSFSGVNAQAIKLFNIESFESYLESSSFSDRVSRQWQFTRSDFKDNEIGLSEGFSLNTTGSIYHPRLLLWNVKSHFSLKQRYLSGTSDDKYRKINEHIENYNINVSLLKDHPHSLRIFSSQNISQVDGDFIVENNIRNNIFGANLSSSMGLLHNLVHYTRARYKSEGLVPSDEIKTSLKYDGAIHTQLNSIDLNYIYDDNNFVNLQRSYSSHSVRIIDSKRFDPVGNTSGIARLYYRNQKGLTKSKYFESSLSGTVLLNKDLQSSVSAAYRRNDINNINSSMTKGTIALTHQLYKSLTSSVSYINYKTNFDAGFNKETNPSFSLNYRKLTFFGALALNYSLNYRDYDIENLSNQSNVELITYEIGIPIMLNGILIDTSSIEITNSPTNTNIYYHNAIDYFIEVQGANVLISIPLSSQITDGDSLFITYITSNNNNYKYDELNKKAGITLSFSKYLVLDASLNNFDRNLIEGMPTINLEDVKITKAGLQLNLGHFSGRLKYIYNKALINPYKKRGISFKYFKSVSRKMSFVTNADYFVTDFPDEQDRISHYNFALTNQYLPKRHISFKSRILYQKSIGRNDDGNNWLFYNTLNINFKLLTVVLNSIHYSKNVKIVGVEKRSTFQLYIRKEL